ncbi:hypothetical protein [Bdellovibrio svalbardensis]|uniref:VCBS repeat-containing protein n=1 Tax=Bdellovibrio svalbardensis TaxID=2972972 RepID=A0ABT6DD83_9BACT|nr:hypothetical protein [Bdellovibrio svalbardensis]MDG0814811.1 hypothetical protein [Bdellovibrio svalbardensis]
MTSKTENAFNKKELILMIALAVLAMALTTVAVIPSLRTKVKEAFSVEDREILAKVSGKIGAQGPRVTVLKIKGHNSLSLEVYDLDAQEGTALLAKIPLAESRDGYFSLQGNATNLALTDVDSDGQMEIVAPTYDDQMVPRLNIFKYNAATKSFDRVSAPEGH